MPRAAALRGRGGEERIGRPPGGDLPRIGGGLDLRPPPPRSKKGRSRPIGERDLSRIAIMGGERWFLRSPPPRPNLPPPKSNLLPPGMNGDLL